MKRTLLVMAGAALLMLAPRAEASWSVGVQIGAPPPPVRVVVVPARPYPEAVWVEGYWYPKGKHYRWRDGYWARPPYPGAIWVGPTYDGGFYVEGYWAQPRHVYRDRDGRRYDDRSDDRGWDRGRHRGWRR